MVTEQCIRSAGTSVSTMDRPRQDANVILLTNVIEEFTLNKEQERAFVIAATYMHHRDSANLRMYLGGMAGTGKSRVVNSLLTFLRRRDEAHRFVVTAPTGSAAALLAGSTYHYVLGFNKSGEAPSLAQLQKIRRRLNDVDLLFIDEVSMVSCRQLYQISWRLSKAMNTPDQSFGGLGVILAGDFAQLPPAGPRNYPLYSSSVGLLSNGNSAEQQENAIGKSLWHTFTTVVMLEMNMRQQGMSNEDVAFRLALKNMRYKSCTKNDISLLRSRIIGSSPDVPKLSDAKFKNVSIITALNAHRDAINEHGAKRFASEHHRRLEYFHSIDEWEAPRASNPGATTLGLARLIPDPMRNNRDLDTNIRELLWKLPPSMTNHRAGLLPLCIGMPVLLKSNEATELCATNGAKATVYSWDFFVDNIGRKVLNTLFVKLHDPPRHIQIGDLPEDVIPIVRVRDRTVCTLPNDKLLYITREQVNVLPNFTMTDFASQGRTRPFNPCHLKHCRGSQSMYTCLSRSSSLQGTVIIDEFDQSKVTGGLTGALRAEFKDVEILNLITRLRYEHRLPQGVQGTHCVSLIKAWISAGKPTGGTCAESALPQALRSVTSRDTVTPGSSMASRARRKRETTEDNSGRPDKRPQTGLSPTQGGPVALPTIPSTTQTVRPATTRSRYVSKSTAEIIALCLPTDIHNASCAYDALVSSLWFISCVIDKNRLSTLQPSNPFMAFLFLSFESIRRGEKTFQSTRDGIRKLLYVTYPTLFSSTGPKRTSIVDLIRAVFKNSTERPYGVSRALCSRCRCVVYNTEPVKESVWKTAPIHGWAHGVNLKDSQSTINALMTRELLGQCRTCGTSLTLVYSLCIPPEAVVIDYDGQQRSDADTHHSTDIRIQVGSEYREYKLFAVFEHSHDHYSVRCRDETGMFWAYDGVANGGRFKRLEATREQPGSLGLAASQERSVCVSVYLPPGPWR